ncbi:D-alanine--D-alanine ligase [Clostridia bacterium]|nr:D-alanine--D-alanine ligase [Clostridia bacterium]
MKKNILVLFNNQSLKAARSVVTNLSDEKYEVIPIGITRKGRWLFYPGAYANIENTIWENDIDCVPAILSPDNLHNGIIKLESDEIVHKKIDLIFSLLPIKGSVQGLFELSKIPFVGASSSVSVVCSDNAYTHAILEYSGMRTAKWKVITQRKISELDAECEKLSENLGFPLAVKPANSDKGFGKANDINSLKECVKTAFLYDSKIVVEEFISGRALQVAMLGYGDDAVPSFVRDKNDPNFMFESDITYKVIDIARRAYKTLGVSGYALVSLFLTDTEILVDEVDTGPDLSETGEYANLMSEIGIDYPYLLERLINLLF